MYYAFCLIVLHYGMIQNRIGCAQTRLMTHRRLSLCDGCMQRQLECMDPSQLGVQVGPRLDSTLQPIVTDECTFSHHNLYIIWPVINLQANNNSRRAMMSRTQCRRAVRKSNSTTIDVR